jgi:hypothetical protein
VFLLQDPSTPSASDSRQAQLQSLDTISNNPLRRTHKTQLDRKHVVAK